AETKTEKEIAEHVTEVKTEIAEPVTEEKTKVEQTVADVKDETPAAVKDKIDETPHENPYEWENIEMPSEFQALFFLVKGIRFAVPLVNLGGIFQCEKITPLFGKPKWFMGIADIRGKKMNVVDTLKWVKSDAPASDKYEYMIALDKTLWSIGCDELEGNRILSKDSVTWRQTAGNRPWLAGIVKKEMCALLHVDALIKMFENGVNLKDLDQQVSD
uniref:chemotaxis protein CheW n=1 Tax=Succinivibrio sp. TaxID=2053619 RepID=UPI003FEFA9B0